MNEVYGSQNTSVAKSFRLTYAYMALGILVTSLASIISINLFGNLITQLYSSKVLYIGLIILQLGLVFVVNRLAGSENKAVALSGYLFFTAFEGVILSPILMLVSTQALVSAIVSSIGLFGIMAILGYTTKLDMSRWYSVLLSLTVAILIAGIINIFVLSSMASFIISIISILVFSAWTAYDNQHLRVAFENANSQDINQIAIMGAFELYLDLLNLFVNLLDIFNRN